MDDFNSIEPFSGENDFPNILLDKDNKVVAIGNPVVNPKVKELYLKVLTGGEVVKAGNADHESHSGRGKV